MEKLIGYARFTSKKGNECFVLEIQKPFAKYQKEHWQCVGESHESVYVPTSAGEKIKPTDIGKEITFEYEVSGGKASVTDLYIK